MSFTNPFAIVGALVVVLVVAYLIRRIANRSSAQAFAYSDLAFAERNAAPNMRWDRLLAGAFLLGVFALAVAPAGPHLVASVPSHDATVVLCVDTSGSMRAADILPSRIDAARNAVRAYIDALPAGTRVGIVAFSSGAVVVQTPTDDRDQARNAVALIPQPNGGTAIGDALMSAARLLPERGARAIVLLTDGVNNLGAAPLDVAPQIGATGTRIFTIGIGTQNGGLIPGTMEEAEIDEDALRSIAAAGHGDYHRATDAAALQGDLANLVRETVWEKKRVDASLPFALVGGICVVLSVLGAATLGRFP
jgi:Ca-activated chloride channel family protein